jgi:bifunctional DNA-binding transcriptional regulator/antitoxin component of YhaV-PrlF toxin-antitoxin module
MNNSPKRSEPSTTWSTKVQKDTDGELYIVLPDDLTDKLNWLPGDIIEFDETEMLGDVFDDTGFTLRNLTQEKDERFSGHIYNTE